MATGNLPKGNNERVVWCDNFETEFPLKSTILGYSTAETTELVNYVINLRYNIQRAQTALAFSKACSAYKTAMLNGVTNTQETPVLPVFNDLTLNATPVEPGIVPFINNALQRIKLSKNYNEAIGQTLMIAGTEEAPLNLTDAKPTAQATAQTGSVVRIEWMKGKFDGVIIESQRDDETAWTRLDRDFRSPFDDERPPLAAGKPEERRYRLRYFIDDKPVGDYSDTINVSTRP